MATHDVKSYKFRHPRLLVVSFVELVFDIIIGVCIAIGLTTREIIDNEERKYKPSRRRPAHKPKSPGVSRRRSKEGNREKKYWEE